jgi:hypothetical protein
MESQGQGRVAKTLPTCYVNGKEIGLREHGFGVFRDDPICV